MNKESWNHWHLGRSEWITEIRGLRPPISQMKALEPRQEPCLSQHDTTGQNQISCALKSSHCGLWGVMAISAAAVTGPEPALCQAEDAELENQRGSKESRSLYSQDVELRQREADTPHPSHLPLSHLQGLFPGRVHHTVVLAQGPLDNNGCHLLGISHMPAIILSTLNAFNSLFLRWSSHLTTNILKF